MRRHNIGYLRVICTNACNLNCVGCHKEGQKIYNEMPATVLYKIISACIGAGIRKVKLIGGEPVMYGDIVALVSNLIFEFLPNNGLLIKLTALGFIINFLVPFWGFIIS